MQLYGGKLSQRCHVISTGKLWEPPVGELTGLCSTAEGSGFICPAGTICGNTGVNPNSGVTSFDNILVAWVTIIQVISLEGWVDIMYAIEDVDGPWNNLYFILLVMIGSFFVINLVTAVIFLRFDQIKRAEQVKKLEDKLRQKFSLTVQESLRVLRKEEKKPIYPLSRLERQRTPKKRTLQLGGNKVGPLTTSLRRHSSNISTFANTQAALGAVPKVPGKRKRRRSIEEQFKRFGKHETKGSAKDAKDSPEHGGDAPANSGLDLLYTKNITKVGTGEKGSKGSKQGLSATDDPARRRSKLKTAQPTQSSNRTQVASSPPPLPPPPTLPLPPASASIAEEEEDDESTLSGTKSAVQQLRQAFKINPFGDSDMERLIWFRGSWYHFSELDSTLNRIRVISYRLVSHQWMGALVFLATLLNSVVLAIDYHGIPEDTSNTLDLVNSVLYFVFAFEALLKIVGLGPHTSCTHKVLHNSRTHVVASSFHTPYCNLFRLQILHQRYFQCVRFRDRDYQHFGDDYCKKGLFVHSLADISVAESNQNSKFLEITAVASEGKTLKQTQNCLY